MVAKNIYFYVKIDVYPKKNLNWELSVDKCFRD